MILGLTQWVESTYQGCKDPTIGRDEEETPEVHECACCGDDFNQHEGKLLDNEVKFCNQCFTKDKVYSWYDEFTFKTPFEIRNITVSDL